MGLPLANGYCDTGLNPCGNSMCGLQDNGAILLFAQTPFDKGFRVYGNIKNLRYEWIWEKEQGTGNLNANKMPLKKTENILVFYKSYSHTIRR